MESNQSLLSRSWDATWSLVSGSPLLTVLIGVAIFVVTLLLSKKLIGKEALHENAKSAGIAIAATVIVGAFVFIANYFWVVPRSIISEQNVELANTAQSQYEQSETISGLQNQIEQLRHDVDKAKEARKIEIAQANVPKLEGLNIIIEQIPSDVATAPFCLELTVQTNRTIQPFGIGIVCDKPLEVARLQNIGAGRNWAESSTGQLENAQHPENTYKHIVNSPSLDPRHPFVFRLYSKEQFSIQKLINLSE